MVNQSDKCLTSCNGFIKKLMEPWHINSSLPKVTRFVFNTTTSIAFLSQSISPTNYWVATLNQSEMLKILTGNGSSLHTLNLYYVCLRNKLKNISCLFEILWNKLPSILFNFKNIVGIFYCKSCKEKTYF